MATYKVIQDIEAEDKLLGPLTLRQFIYAIIVALSGFVAFKLATAIGWWIIAPFLPHMIFFAVLAAPFGHDQSSEVWLLAKIRFFLKPRRRIWDQSGIKELVTVTVPKKIERQLTKNLSQTEVKSRLHALANTIDSRGWAVKNVNVNLFAQPSYVLAQADSDRLIDPSSLPQEVPMYDAQAFEDVFDEQSSSTAQHLTQLITQSEQARRQQVLQNMHAPTNPNPSPQPDYWFLNQASTPPQVDPQYATFNNSSVVQPGITDTNPIQAATPTDEEKALVERLRAKEKSVHPSYTHLKTIQPLSAQNTPDPSVTASPDPAILGLANNDDLNVATLARQAQKQRQQPPDDEVVISLR